MVIYNIILALSHCQSLFRGAFSSPQKALEAFVSSSSHIFPPKAKMAQKKAYRGLLMIYKNQRKRRSLSNSVVFIICSLLPCVSSMFLLLLLPLPVPLSSSPLPLLMLFRLLPFLLRFLLYQQFFVL